MKKIHYLSNIDELAKQADCKSCGRVKILSRGLNKGWRCSIPSNNRSKLKKREYRAVKKAMLVDECEICGSKKNLRWDHCHSTLRFRGTLCNKCNMGIGLFSENIIYMKNAIQYIVKHMDTN